MSQIDILYPPLEEQKKIATILTSVDMVIEKIEAQIEKLELLKKSLMQELLTKGIGHTEFKDSPVGRIPKKWESKPLSEIIRVIEAGVSVNSENKGKLSGELGILKTSSVTKGYFYPNKNKVILIEEITRARVNPLKGSIIFSRMNTPELVGECGYVTETHTDLFLLDRLWRIEVKKKIVEPLWLSYLFTFYKNIGEITKLATGTSGSMKNISKEKLLKMVISVPPIEEQIKIKNMISSIDKKYHYKLIKLKQHKNLKKALMQDLLTGKVRVKVN